MLTVNILHGWLFQFFYYSIRSLSLVSCKTAHLLSTCNKASKNIALQHRRAIYELYCQLEQLTTRVVPIEELAVLIGPWGQTVPVTMDYGYSGGIRWNSWEVKTYSCSSWERSVEPKILSPYFWIGHKDDVVELKKFTVPLPETVF